MKNQKGFTLIELLLVLAIIGIISAIAVPALLGQRERARMQSTKDNTTAVIADLTSVLGELSDPPSERKTDLGQVVYTSSQADNLAKANTAIAYVLARPNFYGSKNPYGSGHAYTAAAVVSTQHGMVFVDSASANVTNDPFITVTGVFKDAKGNNSSLVKTVAVN